MDMTPDKACSRLLRSHCAHAKSHLRPRNHCRVYVAQLVNYILWGHIFCNAYVCWTVSVRFDLWLATVSSQQPAVELAR